MSRCALSLICCQVANRSLTPSLNVTVCSGQDLLLSLLRLGVTEDVVLDHFLEALNSVLTTLHIIDAIDESNIPVHNCVDNVMRLVLQDG